MIGGLSNHLWQSTLFVAFAAIVAFALRKNGAHIRHAVWVTASLKFLVPFSLLMALGSQWAWTKPAAAAEAPTIETASIVMDQIAQPFGGTSHAAPAPERPAIQWGPIAIGSAWALGFAAIVLMRLRGWARVRAAVRSSVPAAMPGAALPPNVEVRASSGLLEPGVVGFRRPVLLVPAGLERQLTPLQLQAVLAHELCHIRRKDNVTAAIHMAVEAIFWFHPLVWWIGARMVDERERACDEHVLRAVGSPEAYAEGILNVCKLYAESPLTCVSGVTGANLKKRIEAIMVNRIGLRLNLARKTAIVVAALFALAAPVVAGIITAPLRAAAAVARQGVAEPQKFEVASIKPCEKAPVAAGARGGGASLNSSPGRMHMECFRAALMIDTAYIARNNGAGVEGWAFMAGSTYNGRDAGLMKVRGGPSWVYTDQWSIEGKAATGADEATMAGPMLRALLEDRFQLKFHTETEDAPMWALTVAKGGLKIKPMKDGDCDPDRSAGPVPMSRAVAEGIKPTCGMVGGGPHGSNWRYEHGGQDLGMVAAMLSTDLGAAVLDKIGVKDKFNIMWEYGPDENTPRALELMRRSAPDAPPPTAANIFTALREQLGLELTKTKGTRRYIVIDHIERPTPDDAFAAPTETFDVVSVKPCERNAPSAGRGDAGNIPITSPGRLYLQCYPLQTMLQQAYLFFAGGRAHALGLTTTVGIEGGPDWIKSERYTVEAATNQAVSAAVMRGPMLQTLLEDRFKLQTRRITREMPVYELVVAKSGAKVFPYTGHDCVVKDDAAWPPAAAPEGQHYCGMRIDTAGSRSVREGVVSLDEFVNLLAFDLPVVNRTGISAPVSLRLEVPKEDLFGGGEVPRASWVSALRDQLGLDIRAAKGPRDFLVIDHAERPGPDLAGPTVRK